MGQRPARSRVVPMPGRITRYAQLPLTLRHHLSVLRIPLLFPSLPRLSQETLVGKWFSSPQGQEHSSVEGNAAGSLLSFLRPSCLGPPCVRNCLAHPNVIIKGPTPIHATCSLAVRPMHFVFESSQEEQEKTSGSCRHILPFLDLAELTPGV